MYGTVSLLDDKHTRVIEDLWDEFKAKLGVKGIHRTPIAHFSYHVAEDYNLDVLREILMPIVSNTKPFRVHSNGLGIFTGEVPVLFIPINPDLELIAFHQRLWKAISESSAVNASNVYYHPNKWQPHITLTHHDVDHDLLPEVVRLLSKRNFSWDIEINNLAVLDGSDEIQTLEYSLQFSG